VKLRLQRLLSVPTFHQSSGTTWRSCSTATTCQTKLPYPFHPSIHIIPFKLPTPVLLLCPAYGGVRLIVMEKSFTFTPVYGRGKSSMWSYQVRGTWFFDSSGWHSDQGSQNPRIASEIRLWKMIRSNPARLLTQNFDARLAGIVMWTDCPLFDKKSRGTSNWWKLTKLTIYVFKKSRGVIFPEKKRLRQAHRPRWVGARTP